MKAKDIISIASAILFESSTNDKDFQSFSPALLNMLVTEALNYENAYRAANGMEELATAPVVIDVETEIPYCDGICRVALPYGLASYYWEDENDNFRAQDCRARFIDALKEASKAVTTDTLDEYQTEE